MPDQTPKMKYKVAISLWLVDINHRLILIFSKRLKLFAFYYDILIYIVLILMVEGVGDLFMQKKSSSPFNLLLLSKYDA